MNKKNEARSVKSTKLNLSGSGQFEKMLEDIADPAESLLSSPDLGGNDSKTGSSHHDETLCGAYVTTVLEICLYLLVYYVAFNSLANRYHIRKSYYVLTCTYLLQKKMIYVGFS